MSAALLASHDRLLLRVDRQVAVRLVTLWRAAMLLAPDAGYRLLVDGATAITARYGALTARAGAELFDAMRVEANVAGAFTATPAAPAALEQVERSAAWALAPMRATRFDEAATLTRLSGAVRRLVRQPERQTIIDNARSDHVRYLRVTRPGACAWCLMLASRGAVYATNTVEFRAHDHCQCFGAPVFNESQIPDETRWLQAEWKAATAGAEGPKAMQAAWREHIAST